MRLFRLFLLGVLFVSSICLQGADGNRLAHLDDPTPYWPSSRSAKFVTPQWIGEPGVEAVIILSIDDMRVPKIHENFLRPILDRLKKIDGRAPVSIMANEFLRDAPELAKWLEEGLSLEVHTLTHPCPCLGSANFEEAQRTYHGGVELLAHVPNSLAVAFRMPCCDSMNSASPRFFAEIFNRANEQGRYLAIDSSVFSRWKDPRFDKYFPAELRPPMKISLHDYAGLIEEYPYPYLFGQLAWEFPCAPPSDWEAFNISGPVSADALADWKDGLDRTVRAQGMMTTVFHPHGWCSAQQWVEFIDYAEATYGKRVKFLTFREALERLEKHALAGIPVRRAADGGDNGVRILDIDGDGYMDVLTRRGDAGITRIWKPSESNWVESPTPFRVHGEPVPNVRFAVLGKDAGATAFEIGDKLRAWTWREGKWQTNESAVAGLSGMVPKQTGGKDPGWRFRDLDSDGVCELIANREVLRWNAEQKSWKPDVSLPDESSVVDAEGRDSGLRFVDLNEDGFEDLIYSNEQQYAVYLWAPKNRPDLALERGWSHRILGKKRSPEGWSLKTADDIPPFVRDGQNNGVWFNAKRLVVQNEDTVKLEAHTWIRSFEEIITFKVPEAMPPTKSLEAMVPRPGFQVELVAAEPVVESPVAFDWDAEGRLWVVEMRDYPLGMDGKGQPGGRIKVLRDADGDGQYESAQVFAEDLPYPTGVFPSGDGVIVAAPPDILFLADRDGDGRADEQRVLFTGFHPGNQQHRMNGFEWGLDGWIYGANGDSGGKVRPGGGGDAVSISGRDFRFRADGSAFEPESGQVQFGRRRDDWGNWFGNNNATWLWHYTFEDRYLRRNPKLAVKSVRRTLANYRDSQRVYPAYALADAPMRLNHPGSLGYTTSACSASPYRDELFGPEFEGSIFISEPMYNVVHREVLIPHGATFSSRRAGDEKDREFLASRDVWFRPTTVKTGPDGALYIADFYRFVLEHPEWIPAETQARLDLRGGADKGRIYRVFPKGRLPRPVPNLAKLAGTELVRAMDSPNGWQRDNVQRLLMERGGGNDAAIVQELLRLEREAKNPKVRVQAVASVASLGVQGAERIEAVRIALRDAHPQVRVHAIRAAEGAHEDSRLALVELLRSAERDPEYLVRRQLALTLGEFRDDGADAEVLGMLERLAEREVTEEQMRTAIQSSLRPEEPLFARLNAAAASAKSRTTKFNLPPASPNRMKVLERYVGVEKLKGDAKRGNELFRLHCATCHRLKGEGVEVGPDLAMVKDKPTEWLLAAIFDPNAAIEARYQAQLVSVKSGPERVGIVATETGNSITLRLPGGAEEAVLRSEIVAQKSLGQSLMPEGLEGTLDPQAIADLLAWMRDGAAASNE